MDLDAILERGRRRRLPDPATRRELRRRCRLTQEDVGEAIGVARGTVSRYETGSRDPRGVVRERYAALLRVLADELRAA